MAGMVVRKFVILSLHSLQQEAENLLHSDLPRLHLNVFASMGQVSETIRVVFAYPKFSGGGGLRFQLLKTNPTLIRMDFGINQYGDTGLYFGVNEVF